MASSEARNSLRSLLLTGAPPLKVVVEGEEFAFRVPSIKERKELLGRFPESVDGRAPQLSMAIMLDVGADIVFKYLIVPETGERVFEDADRTAFNSQPSNSKLDKLCMEAMRLVFPSVSVPEEKKDFRGTANGSLSLPSATASG